MTEDALHANLAPNAFAGTAEDYARFRPPYPPELFARLVAHLPAKDRVLDLGCGPGRVSLAVAPMFAEVWAVDSEPEMITVGRRIAFERGLSNVAWYCARAEDFDAPADSFDLITIGEAFHRLDQRRIRASASRWLKRGGALATMGGESILEGREPWQQAVRALAEEWTRSAFPRGWASSLPGSETEPQARVAAFERSGFINVADYTFVEPHAWSLDEVVGYLRSASVCAPSILGERRQGFEAALRSALLALDPTGVFREDLTLASQLRASREFRRSDPLVSDRPSFSS